MNLDSELRWLILLGIIAFGVFANSLGGDFVYDDSRQILRNPLIQDSSLYKKALISDVWAFKGDGTVAASNYYRPTFAAWLIFNFKIFGINAFGWHLLNLLLHIGVCWLAFLLLRRWNVENYKAFAISLIFAVHPVHSESVAWISGSPDLLFSIFLLGAFWFAENISQKYIKTAEEKPEKVTIDYRNLSIALVFYAFALGSKEVGILCFPLFFLIFAKSASKSDSIRLTALFLLVAALFFGLRWLVLGVISLPTEDSVTFGQTILTIPAMFLFYLKQIFFPISLSINHSLRPVSGINFTQFIVPLLFALAAFAAFRLLAKKSFVQKFGFALFILTLAPALNATAFPFEQIVHDRYLYLPLLGFLMMTVPYFAELIENTAKDKSKISVIVIAIIIGLPLALQTFFYNRTWKSDLALWTNAVSADKNSAVNWAQYGAALSENGRTDEAVNAYNNSLAIRPSGIAYYGRARNLTAQNKIDEAIFDTKRLIETPNSRINAYLLYQSYELIALALSQQQKYDEAQKYLSEARNRLPIYRAALTEKLAVVMYQSGDKTSALRELEGAREQSKIEFLPESKAVLLRLGMLYAEQNRKPEAKNILNEYLKLTEPLKDNTTKQDRAAAINLLKTL